MELGGRRCLEVLFLARASSERSSNSMTYRYDEQLLGVREGSRHSDYAMPFCTLSTVWVPFGMASLCNPRFYTNTIVFSNVAYK
jgi:hypothetical protein